MLPALLRRRPGRLARAALPGPVAGALSGALSGALPGALPGALHGAFVVMLLVSALAATDAALAQAPAGVPLMKEPLKAAPAAASAAPASSTAAPPAKPGTPRTINWEALVPANWDPFKDFKGMDFQTFDDADPRAMQFLKRMREVWDSAPPNPQLAGQDVRIPGFVVPLEEGKEGIKEFLLVPYFGACIHSPPPPANQIIHVLPRSPAKGVRSMDAVWISGRLNAVRTDSFMGAASYRIEATEVAPYREGGR